MKTTFATLGLALGLSMISTSTLADNSFPVTAAPEGAKVYIISPQDGETVTSPVTVQFGLKGMGVAPAGVERKNTGHHHLMVDVDELPAAGMPITANDNFIHFGGGQTETTIKLDKGTHTLQLNLADHNHVPFAPAILSEKITITVK